MARPPILRIHASSSLTEEVFSGKETFLRVLREVVMEEFVVIFTKVFDGMSINLPSKKFVQPDLFDKAFPVMQDILMGNAMRRVVPANISPTSLMQNH